MAKYRKKPVVIEAEQFTLENRNRVFAFITCACEAIFDDERNLFAIKIQTLEGIMMANLGDWIIKGINDEFYPCKPDIFEKSYNLVEDE